MEQFIQSYHVFLLGAICGVAVMALIAVHIINRAERGKLTARDIALMVADAGENKISLKDDKNFTGTYWISANDLYFYITGRHLNADREHGIIPPNDMMDMVAKR